jgi:chorismate mutase-like protein
MANTHPDGLEAMRAELDEIDRRLLNAIRDRMQVVNRIADYKRIHDVAVMQPDRMKAIRKRVEAFARENKIDVAFLDGLYDAIFAETCRVEEEVIGAAK